MDVYKTKAGERAWFVSALCQLMLYALGYVFYDRFPAEFAALLGGFVSEPTVFFTVSAVVAGVFAHKFAFVRAEGSAEEFLEQRTRQTTVKLMPSIVLIAIFWAFDLYFAKQTLPVETSLTVLLQKPLSWLRTVFTLCM